MGYEVKLFAVERISDEGYCSVVAEIDLCKPGEGAFMTLHKTNKGDGRAYVYGLDGNTAFNKDRYDDAMSIMKVDDVISAIAKDNRKQKYRRYNIALAFLKAFKKDFGKEARILGFGH